MKSLELEQPVTESLEILEAIPEILIDEVLMVKEAALRLAFNATE